MNNTRKKNTSELNRFTPIVGILIAVVLTAVVHAGSLEHALTNWDDGKYVLDNPYVQNTGEHLDEIFTTPSPDNYIPLTILSLGIDRYVWQGNTFGYHFTNWCLHLFNTILVFLFIYKLTLIGAHRLFTFSTKQQLVAAWGIALLTALAFGIHPMHVESVAWVSERKDVLYSAFFLSGLLVYIKYLELRQLKYYLFSFLLFLAACLSKPAAIVFPLIAALCAWWYYSFSNVDFDGNKHARKQIVAGLAPMLIVSLIFGVITIQIQQSSAIAGINQFSLWQRISFAGYGLWQYLLKLLAPFKLAALYPFPVHLNSDSLPLIFAISPLIAVIIGGVFYYMSRKNKIWAFAGGFYLINLLLVLQLLSVGNAVIADRYTYLAYIGIFFLLAYHLVRWILTSKKFATLSIAVTVLLLCSWMFLSWKQVKVWQDSEQLWTNTITNTSGNALAYVKRGEYYRTQNELNNAIYDFTQAIKYQPNFPLAYSNRGYTYFKQKNYDVALQDFNRAIELDDSDYYVYNSRGHLYYELKNYDAALEDYTKAISINNNYAKAFNNRAIIYHTLGKTDLALQDYNSALEINPNYQSALKNRALLREQLKTN